MRSPSPPLRVPVDSRYGGRSSRQRSSSLHLRLFSSDVRKTLAFVSKLSWSLSSHLSKLLIEKADVIIPDGIDDILYAHVSI